MQRAYSLTALQMSVAQAIHEIAAETGVPPSIRELANELDSHPGAIHRCIDALVDRGWLVRLPGRARSLTLLREPPPLPPEPVFVLAPDLAAGAAP